MRGSFANGLIAELLHIAGECAKDVGEGPSSRRPRRHTGSSTSSGQLRTVQDEGNE